MPLPADYYVTPAPPAEQAFACFRFPAAAGAVKLMLVGRLDRVTADLAREAIGRAQDESAAVTCDLREVWFVDVSGLRVLLDAAAQAVLTGGRLTIANCPPVVPRMLEVLKLEDKLELGDLTPRVPSGHFRRRAVA